MAEFLEVRTRTRRPVVVLASVLMVLSSAAMAGSPLKGIDVKLGKNPGGGVASRVTDSAGHFDFGVRPKGSYRITILLPKGPELADVKAIEIIVSSAVAGTSTTTLLPLDSTDASRKSGAVIAADFALVRSDGVHPITGVIATEDDPSAAQTARSHLRGTVTLLK